MAPLSLEFSKQEYWSALPFPSPGDLPDPGIKPRSPALKADSLLSEAPGKPWLYVAILQTSSLGASQAALVVKELPANAGDTSLIPGLGRPCGGGNGNSLQYSRLEIFMDRGAWWALSVGPQRVRRNCVNTHISSLIVSTLIHNPCQN